MGAGLIVALVVQQRISHAKAWPLAQAVAQRLATDEGARALWAENPGLRQDYDNEEAFLSAVRAGRMGLGALVGPEPPSQHHSPWFKVASPWNIMATVQGSGGGWLQIQIQRPGPFERPQGEGITLVQYSPDWDGLQQLRQARKFRFLASRYAWVQKVAGRLASTQGTRQLWEQERLLHVPYPTPEALEVEAQRLRPHLQRLPERVEDASPALRMRRTVNPFMDRVDVRWKDPVGREVGLSWENESLVDLRLDPPHEAN